MSILESFLVDKRVSLEQLQSYYPTLEGKDDRGKMKIEYPNRYYIMYGDTPLEGAKEAYK